MRTSKIVVKIEACFSMSEHELRTKFKHWLEHNAHTTSSFGFELKETSRVTSEDE